MKILTSLTCLTLFILSINNAYSFSEDLCFYKKPNQQMLISDAFNCWDLTCTDGIDSHGAGAMCLGSGVITYVNASNMVADMAGINNSNSNIYTRNSLHFDTTFLLARVAGVDPITATTIASYSQLTDSGIYQHYNHQGEPMGKQLSLWGVKRTNFDSLGLWLHYTPKFDFENPLADKITANYNKPELDKPLLEHIKQYRENLDYNKRGNKQTQTPFTPQEHTLNHLRNWAFGIRKDVCEFALTQDLNKPDAPCLTPKDNKSLFFSIPVVKIQDRNYAAHTLSWQRIKLKENCIDTGPKQQVNLAYQNCYQRNYAKSNSRSAQALGVYLHSLTDRLSHSVCVEQSLIKQANNNNKDYQLIYPDACGTVAHGLTHYLELGHKRQPPRTRHAVKYTYWEIQKWMKSVLNLTPKTVNETQLFNKIFTALKTPKAQDRILALSQVAGDYCIAWHDGTNLSGDECHKPD